MVQPGADPRQIALDVGAGLALPERAPQAASLHVDGNGDLVVATEGGEVTFHKPAVYQPATESGQVTKDPGQVTKDEHFVDGNYILKDGSVTFEVTSYDKTRPLVIDPFLAYSTYLGEVDDALLRRSIAVDASGNTYVFDIDPDANAFVTKLNAAGSALIYSTYLGFSIIPRV